MGGNTRTIPKGIQLTAISILFLAVTTVGIHVALHQNALGFDYMFSWHAGRALLLEGLSPYSPEVTGRIQAEIYGRPALPGEYAYPFPYPLPALFVPLPLYWLPYDWSQAAWMALNLMALLAALLFAARRALHPGRSPTLAPARWPVLTIALFYPFTFTWVVGNYALPIGILFIVLFSVLFEDRATPGWVDFGLGLGLAWAVHKPQLAWLLAILALLAAWRFRRLRLLAGFGIGLAGLHAASLALLPGWYGQWLAAAAGYTLGSAHVPVVVPALNAILPGWLSWAVCAILCLALIAATVLLGRAWWLGRLPWLALLGWCALVTNLADLSAMTPDQLVLFVPAALWAARQEPTRRFALAWLAAIATSYLCFALDRFGGLYGMATLGLLAVYCAWLAGVWVRFHHIKRLLSPFGNKSGLGSVLSCARNEQK